MSIANGVKAKSLGRTHKDRKVLGSIPTIANQFDEMHSSGNLTCGTNHMEADGR